MSKQYKGSLDLEWYNKQKSILLKEASAPVGKDDIPASKINWINKDDALFYEIDETENRGLVPYWVDRNDIRVKETRPLIFKKTYIGVPKKKDIVGNPIAYNVNESDIDDPDVENILIRGDNLLALNTLNKMFDQRSDEEKVQCVYLDPPFNTDQAFEHYDDNLTHSEWLTLMRDRLAKIKNLLKLSGLIFIQTDDTELHYLKILMDEVFGRGNFIRQICYERSGAAGIGQGGVFVDTTEYILIYARDRNLMKINQIADYEPLNLSTMKRYNKILVEEGAIKLFKEFVSKSNGLPVKIYKHDSYDIKTISLRDFDTRKNEIYDQYREHFNKIFRTTNPQRENTFQNELISYMDQGLYSVEYTPSRGKRKDSLTKIHYHKNEIFAYLKDTAKLEDDNLLKRKKMTTVWLHGDIPKADLANEGGVELKRSKKPEQLLRKIIEIGSEKNDIILDCFGGSGTTFAAAHKMGLRWIGIEIGKHTDTHIIKRLKNVIDGSDQSGISKALNWNGGGSFKYYHLGPSIIDVDENGNGDFNWSLGRKFIEESLLTTYDFVLQKDVKILPPNLFRDDNRPAVGILNIGSKTLAAVCSLDQPDGNIELIDIDEVKTIYESLKEKFSPEYLTIFTNRGVEMALDSKPDDLEIIKVPNAIFAELEK
jgi:adenine-specific DNA-methyltransferase